MLKEIKFSFNGGNLTINQRHFIDKNGKIQGLMKLTRENVKIDSESIYKDSLSNGITKLFWYEHALNNIWTYKIGIFNDVIIKALY